MKVAVALLIPGALSLTFSVLNESQVMAFIGLGLTFWGALFFLLKPKKYVEGTLLKSEVIPFYSTIDRIIRDLGHKSVGYYVPPYPKDIYLPEHLKGLKEAVIFFPDRNDSRMPSIEEMAEAKFLLQNPKGTLIASPGAGLLSQIERELNVDFGKTQLEQLNEILPRSISENFNLARALELELEGNQVHLKVLDSLYKDLYGTEIKLKSISIVGCPIASAVACAVAKVSGKPVIVEKQKVSPDGLTIEVWYRIMQE
jgi:hypothetical protein